MLSFRHVLREHRLAAGYSQQGLAERAGISWGAIAALEQGVRRDPYRNTVRALADALGGGDAVRCQLEEAAARPRRGQRTDRRSNLPVSLTSFIERNELAEIEALLPSHRLITITGPGGVGKTRLATEVALRCARSYDETFFVDLLPLRDGALLASELSHRLNVPVDGEDGLAKVVDYLRSRRVLCVIDNCEHLTAYAAWIIDRLLRAAPHTSVLATSRQALEISAELVFRLPPMAAEVAAKLFVTRARTADRSWSVDARRFSLVTEICRNLEGIPLAIELAASRLPALGLEGLQRRLENGLTLTGNRDLPLRHRTMVSTIAWSYELLTDAEQLLLRRLSVLVDGFSLETAEEVCADDRLTRVEVADTIGSLVRKSLIDVRHVDTSIRYAFLAAVRAFARELLAEAGEVNSGSKTLSPMSRSVDAGTPAFPMLSSPRSTATSNRA
jgi:predicted ATPase/DNA-binding XRE family transcriptional regulator